MQNDKLKNLKVTCKLDWIFGIRKDIWPNIFILDLETIVYPASNYVVIYNHKKTLSLSEQQTFISGTPFSKGIKSIAVTSIGKKYVVVAEEMQEGTSISAYSVAPFQGVHNFPHKIASFTCSELKIINRIHHMSFSQREKGNSYFMAVAQVEGLMLVLWKWDWLNDMKEKDSYVYPISGPGIDIDSYGLRKSNNNSVSNSNLFIYISFSLYSNDQFCLISNSFFQFYTIVNEKRPQLKYTHLFDEYEGEEVYHYSWLQDGLFTVTTQENIYIFFISENRVISKIKNDNNSTIGFINQIYDNERFVLALGSNGLMEIYCYNKKDLSIEYESNNISFNKVFSQKVELDSNTRFDFLCCVYNGSEVQDIDKVYKKANEYATKDHSQNNFGLNNYEIYTYFATTTNNDLIKLTIKYSINNKTYTYNVEYLISPFHGDSVEGLDICISKPYIITGGKDKSLKIWDYLERKLVQSKMLEEEIYTVAYHPNGMHALVSGPEKIRALNVYYDDITYMTQSGIATKKSKDIRFSNGGQFFAFDSNLKVEIWDFLNMHPLNNDQHNIRTKINAISFKHNDEAIFICCAEALYEWKLGDTPYRPTTLKNINFTSACYIPSSNNEIIASADDGSIKRFTDLANNIFIDNKFEYIFTHLCVFKTTGFLLGCCTNSESNISKEANIFTQIQTKSREFNPLLSSKKSTSQAYGVSNSSSNSFSTCIRLFQDINYLSNSNSNEALIPSHLGETTRIRINFDENLIFTAGKDSCINMYSIVENTSDMIEESKSLLFNKGLERFTDVVLMKKSKLKELEIEKTNLPEKKNEAKNSKKSAINEEINDLLKKRDDLSTLIAANKKAAQDEIQRKKDELEEFTERAGKDLDELNNELHIEYEKQKNEYQIELTDMQRKVESRREELRKNKENFKRLTAELKRAHLDRMETIRSEKMEKLKKLENHEKELDDMIESLKSKQIVDIETIEWLNKKVLSTIDDNTNEFKRGIDNLRNHHKQQENKLKEKKEKQKNDLEVLNKELTQIKEQKDYQSRRKKQLDEQKKVIIIITINYPG